MSYEIRIVRPQNTPISTEEWKIYVNSDSEMELADNAETLSPQGQTIRVEIPDSARWKGHSRFKNVWFRWARGEIYVSNPDEETLQKMREIARFLGAEVRGEEDETP